MPIEHVAASAVTKPWGVADPRPWMQPRGDGASIGEFRYQRTDAACSSASLLLKQPRRRIGRLLSSRSVEMRGYVQTGVCAD
jgi:hypothetical protein